MGVSFERVGVAQKKFHQSIFLGEYYRLGPTSDFYNVSAQNGPLNRNNYTYLITNSQDLGFVSSASVKSTLLFFSTPKVARIDVNFMSNTDKRFDKKFFADLKLFLMKNYYFFV